jgi:predicted acyltransferase
MPTGLSNSSNNLESSRAVTELSSTRDRSADRWKGLDAFRGLAVIGMLLVNNPGNHDAVFAPLRHSQWNGCSAADLVFPFFLFVVGITTTIVLAARRGDDTAIGARIWRRAALIFGIGILLNWFPFYQSGQIAWTDHATFLDRIIERLLQLRIPGVMQRIAIAYLVAALLARRTSSRVILSVTVALLLGYWALLTIVPVPGEGLHGAMLLDQPSRTIVAHVDRALFDWTRWGLGDHLWDSARTWDPEGALSTIPSIATVLLGVLCGRWMIAAERPHRIEGLLIAGAVATVVGWCWALVFPLNKSLWTSSYVLVSAGIGAVVFALLSAALDGRRDTRWARPLIIFGENPLIAYSGSELARHILHSSIKIPLAGRRLGTDEWTTQILERAGLSADAASLGWALAFLTAWLFVLSRFSRRRLVVRV